MVLGDGGGQGGAWDTVGLVAFVPWSLVLWQPVTANAPKASRVNIFFIYCSVVDVAGLTSFLSKINYHAIYHTLSAQSTPPFGRCVARRAGRKWHGWGLDSLQSASSVGRANQAIGLPR